jgi:hypothetical protein
MIYNLRDAVVTIIDGTPTTPNELELVADEGDLAFSENKEVFPVYDRGSIAFLRNGNAQLHDVSLTMKFQGLKGSGTPTPYEALKKIGDASAWQSTYADSEVYCLDIQIEVNDPKTQTLVETITLSDFFYEKIDFKEGEEYDTLAVSGKCLSVDVS